MTTKQAQAIRRGDRFLCGPAYGPRRLIATDKARSGFEPGLVVIDCQPIGGGPSARIHINGLERLEMIDAHERTRGWPGDAK